MSITKRPLFYWVLHRQRSLQLVLLLVILLSIVFRVFPLEMQKRIVNEGINLRNEHLLFLYCGLFLAGIVIAGITKYIINLIQVRVGQKILIELRTELYNHILQLPLQFYRTMPPGTVVSAMTAELNAIGFFLGGALAIPVSSVLIYVAFFAYMFYLNPLLAVLSVAIYPVELVLIPLMQKRYNRWNGRRIKTIRKMSNAVNEAISGIHEVQANAAFGAEERRLRTFIMDLYEQLERLFFIKYGIKFVHNFIQGIGPFFLFLIGGYLAIHGQFSLGALVAFLSAYEKIYDPWKELLEFYQSYQDARVRYAQVMKAFDCEPAHLLTRGEGEPFRATGSITFQDVSLALPGGVTLLNHVSLRIRPGEMVAVVGPSGCGKTSMALLVSQLYDPTAGTLLLDGHDIATLSKEDISANVTLVSQNPFIFSGTVRDNLLYGLGSEKGERQHLPDRRELQEMCRNVALEADILWLGATSVLPEEKVPRYREQILQMRRMIRNELKDDFSRVVEFYDINKFLRFASLRDNIIFGECASGRYSIDNLPENTDFLRLLTDTGLEEDLVRIGLALARISVEAVEARQEGGITWRDALIREDERELYEKVVRRTYLRGPSSRDRKALVILALRYIPGKHAIIPLTRKTEEKILRARHYFLNTIVQANVAFCQQASDLFSRGESLPPPSGKTPGKDDFTPYCPTRYMRHRDVRTNILFGSPIRGDSEIRKLQKTARKAFEQAGLLEYTFDIGLDFEVGSKGDRLSGGQRQKIAIARGLLRDTPILILDEATASLDNRSQQVVQHHVARACRGRKTLLSVIHRLDLAPSYDRILVMEDGRIVEDGGYEELLAAGGRFARLAGR
ncbi:MAG: ABC transporter ATP-binding protein [Desulfobulbaceae bacterium]